MAKKKLNEATEETTPATEETLAPPPKLVGRVAWCEDCFAASVHGPEPKLDASGMPRVYTPAGETCHACEKPAEHYAPGLYVGDRYQVSRPDFSGIVTVAEVGDAGAFTGAPDGAPTMACNVAECACL